MDLGILKKIGKANTVAMRIASSIISLIILFILLLKIYNPTLLIPEFWINFMLGFLFLHLFSNLGSGIVEIHKSKKVFPICHYCPGTLEISQYKCKECGKLQ